MKSVIIKNTKGTPANAGMNLWLTKEMKLVYREDWAWCMLAGDLVYTFRDEKMATAFALRWA